MRRSLLFFFVCISYFATGWAADSIPNWTLSALPASVRIDPASHRIYDQPYAEAGAAGITAAAMLQKNWVYNGNKVTLQAARGEYVSFQLVLTNESKTPLTGIDVAMPAFRGNNIQLANPPELFLEWAVEVKTPSTGYPTASLGTGWYPDALIPLASIQQGTTPPKRAWVYPLMLPDFNNRIPNQRSQIIWVDQYIPFEKDKAPGGTYESSITVTIKGISKAIPVKIAVWDFAIANENRLRASLQHEGFVSHMDEKSELEIYQLMKRNRVGLMDPTYKPEINKTGNSFTVDWTKFDHRLKKYLTGEAFTKEYGYNFGPGYGTPFETFLLPFDVYGKHDTRGWPDVGTPAVEKNKINNDEYIAVIHFVRDHLRPMIDLKTTELTVYLNGLDESYFPEAWARMAYYGKLFKKEYPEAKFRVDGAYGDSAMMVIDKAISAWAVHTIEFDEKRMEKYTRQGIDQWLYGPMIYESKVNSWVGSSTFTDLPLVNDRAISWSVWKYKAHSWISWGVGAGWKAGWYDSETWKRANDGGNGSAEGTDQKKLNGNALLIYSPGIIPNVHVACPSIRLKTYRDGIQEYEYMRLLSAIDKNEQRVSMVVNGVIGKPFGDQSVGKIDVWSYDPEKWDNSRLRMGAFINQSLKNAKK